MCLSERKLLEDGKQATNQMAHRQNWKPFNAFNLLETVSQTAGA